MCETWKFCDVVKLGPRGLCNFAAAARNVDADETVRRQA